MFSLKEKQHAVRKLIPVVKGLLSNPLAKAFLKSSKQKGAELLRRDDFVWYEILLSFATWGNSRGAGKLKFAELAYERLLALNDAERLTLVVSEFETAGIRYAAKKSGYLLYNFRLVEKKGGEQSAKQAVLADAHGPEAKKKALREYKGIGKKYANNIMMDAYHEEFHDSIAVDQRIKNISKELGLPASKYEDYVEFYQEVAERIDIQAWELDRLLYRFQKVVLAGLRTGAPPTEEMIQQALAPVKN